MREYRVSGPDGSPLTLQLSDEDARRYGARAVLVETAAPASPENKARTARTRKAKARP